MSKLNDWFINTNHNIHKIIITDYNIHITFSNSDGTFEGYGYGCGENINDCRGHGHYYANKFKGINNGSGCGAGRGDSNGSSH